jgi:acyl carrier protein
MSRTANDGAMAPTQGEARALIGAYITENLLLGTIEVIDDDASLLESGVLDSTGVMEMVAFIEETFHLSLDDADLTPENLDSIDRICTLIARRRAC